VSWEHFVAINLDICARLPGPDAPAQD